MGNREAEEMRNELNRSNGEGLGSVGRRRIRTELGLNEVEGTTQSSARNRNAMTGPVSSSPCSIACETDSEQAMTEKQKRPTRTYLSGWRIQPTYSRSSCSGVNDGSKLPAYMPLMNAYRSCLQKEGARRHPKMVR